MTEEVKTEETQAPKTTVCKSCGNDVSMREAISGRKCPHCGESISGGSMQVLRS